MPTKLAYILNKAMRFLMSGARLSLIHQRDEEAQMNQIILSHVFFRKWSEGVVRMQTHVRRDPFSRRKLGRGDVEAVKSCSVWEMFGDFDRPVLCSCQVSVFARGEAGHRSVGGGLPLPSASANIGYSNEFWYVKNNTIGRNCVLFYLSIYSCIQTKGIRIISG